MQKYGDARKRVFIMYKEIASAQLFPLLLLFHALLLKFQVSAGASGQSLSLSVMYDNGGFFFFFEKMGAMFTSHIAAPTYKM